MNDPMDVGIDMNEAYCDGFEAGVKSVKPRWIPVTEKMPETAEPVLIFHRNGVSYGWYNGAYWTRGAVTHHKVIQTVTHWMPLPEPPEEETNR